MMQTVLRVLPLALGLVLITLFLRLGQWQSDRAAFKDDLFASFDAAAELRPVRSDRLDGLDDYQPVELDGELLADLRIYLENQLVAGRDGVHVFAPLRLTSGETILVNFGWRPLGSRRELPEAVDLTSEAPFAGLVAPMPAGGIRLGELNLADAQPPFRVPWLDNALLGNRLNLELSPQILLMTAPSDAFRRAWRPVTMEASRHRGYAFQWYALASAVGILTLWGGWRLLRRPWTPPRSDTPSTKKP